MGEGKGGKGKGRKGKGKGGGRIAPWLLGDGSPGLKIPGIMLFSLHTTFSSSLHCSVRHEVKEFRCCNCLRSCVSSAGC